MDALACGLEGSDGCSILAVGSLASLRCYRPYTRSWPGARVSMMLLSFFFFVSRAPFLRWGSNVFFRQQAGVSYPSLACSGALLTPICSRKNALDEQPGGREGTQVW